MLRNSGKIFKFKLNAHPNVMFNIQGKQKQTVKALSLGQAFLFHLSVKARVLPKVISVPFLEIFFLIFSNLVLSHSDFTN